MSAFSRHPNEVELAGGEKLDAERVQRYGSKLDAENGSAPNARTGWGSRVIEFGPGTGQFTLPAAATGARVTTVHVSLPMLQHLGAKIAERDITDATPVDSGFLSYSPTGGATVACAGS